VGTKADVSIFKRSVARPKLFLLDVNSIKDQLAQNMKLNHLLGSEDAQPVIASGQVVRAGDQIATGSFVNPIFYKHLARIMLLLLFALIAGMVYVAYRRRIALNN
jgi:hypothetical protein